MTRDDGRTQARPAGAATPQLRRVVDGWIRDLFRAVFPGPAMQIFVKSITGKIIVLDIGAYTRTTSSRSSKEGITHSEQVITVGAH